MPESAIEVTYKSIGQHPVTGENIYIRTRRFQPQSQSQSQLLSQVIIIGDSPEKCNRIQLPGSLNVDGITPDMVLELESLKLSPRYLGRHPVTGYRIEIKIDWQNAFLVHRPDSINNRSRPDYRNDLMYRCHCLSTIDNLLNITLKQAVIKLAEPSPMSALIEDYFGNSDKILGEFTRTYPYSDPIPLPEKIFSSKADSLAEITAQFEAVKDIKAWKKKISLVDWYNDVQEKFIQVAISHYLTLKGIDNKMESHLGKSRMDIYIPGKKMVVEVKKIIDVSSLDKGVTQVTRYAKRKGIAHKILIGLPCKDQHKREEMDEWIKLLSDRFLEIHLLNVNLDDLDLDRIFQLDRETPTTFIEKISRFAERIAEIISTYFDANVKTTKQLFQTSPALRLNPS